MSTARTSPSRCCDPLTTPETQTGSEPHPAPACQKRGHQHVQSQGGCYNGLYTTERLQLLCKHKSWIQLSSAASPVRSRAVGAPGELWGRREGRGAGSARQQCREESLGRGEQEPSMPQGAGSQRLPRASSTIRQLFLLFLIIFWVFLLFFFLQ